jgi:hypothetical protein
MKVRTLEEIEKQKAWVVEQLGKDYHQLSEDQIIVMQKMDSDIKARIHWEAYLQALRWVSKDRKRTVEAKPVKEESK